MEYGRQFGRYLIIDRLAARISHPNVAQVVELGQHKGSFFIAMEYVEGESLSMLLRRRWLPWSVGGRILADALGGLHAAHEIHTPTGEPAELVHRDLSPSNVLIGYDGVVKVVDFGVARARGMLHTTEAGTLKGKCAYMSPEQATNQELDRRSDIFTAGILLFETTTRRRLFLGSTDAESVELVRTAEIPSPSSLVPGYPPQLERVVRRALERNPAKRYGTAREMQLAIEECIFAAGSPVLPATVGDLMWQVFAEEIRAKRELIRQALQTSAPCLGGGPAPNPQAGGESPSIHLLPPLMSLCPPPPGASVSSAHDESSSLESSLTRPVRLGVRRGLLLGGTILLGLGLAVLVLRHDPADSRREPRLVWPRTEDETLVATPASGGAARVDVRVVDRSSRDGGVSVPQRPVPNPRAADTKRARFRARERTSNARAGRLLGSPYAD